jgi:hypothetical protein
VLERLASFVAPGGTLVGNLWIADHYHEFGRKRYGATAHLVRTASYAVWISATGNQPGRPSRPRCMASVTAAVRSPTPSLV